MGLSTDQKVHPCRGLKLVHSASKLSFLGLRMHETIKTLRDLATLECIPEVLVIIDISNVVASPPTSIFKRCGNDLSKLFSDV